MSTTTPEASIMSGVAWANFCDTLKSAGNVILNDRSAANPFDRAEGFRYLSRLARKALERFLENGSVLWPTLLENTFMVTHGLSNPDNLYLRANISGRHEYRVWGTRGTVPYLSFGTYSGDYYFGGQDKEHASQDGGIEGLLEGDQLQVDADGAFDVLLSCDQREGNWLRMGPHTSELLIRQTFLDRSNEEPARLHIQRLGAEGRPPPVTPTQVAEGLAKAGRNVVGIAKVFAEWTEGYAQHPNELRREDKARSATSGADPNIDSYHGYWRLAPDEAMLIEATPPECDWWGFQLCTYWMESINFPKAGSHINKHTAWYERDGSVRIVVAHEDTGVPNWMDTAGHAHGTMCLRWVKAFGSPQPTIRVVPVADLSG